MFALKALAVGATVVMTGCTVQLIQPPPETPIELTVVLPKMEVSAPTSVNNHTTVHPEPNKEPPTLVETDPSPPPLCDDLSALIAEPAFDVTPYETNADSMPLLRAALKRISRYDRTLDGVQLNGQCKEKDQ